MEAGMVLLILALTAAVFCIQGVREEGKRKKELCRRIHSEYGTARCGAYTEGEMEGISGYYRAHRQEGQIDDITWNDLEMDRIFFGINHTRSSAGQEYLYYLLHTPDSGEEPSRIREETVGWFSDHEKERERLEFLYAGLGKSGRYSIYDYLSYLDRLGERGSFRSIAGDVLFFAAFLIMPFSVTLSFAVVFLVIVANMFYYIRRKAETEPYLASFAYVQRILDFCTRLRKERIPVLAEEYRELEKLDDRFRKFRRSAVLGMRGSKVAGDPLSIVMDYVNMLFHLDLICFNSMLRQVRDNFDAIDRMTELAGRTECQIAVASFRASLDNGWCVPEFTEDRGMQAVEMYHPLLREPVKNSLSAERSILITGSNASGKSTFLKTAAVNALLAQTVHTCCARSYRAGFYRILTSMALRDDLESGESYFMAEIRALKRMFDQADREGTPVLCCVDEVLRGTNTVERIAASVQVLRNLERPDVLCLAATHDIELTELLKDQFDNCHFEESVKDGTIHFDYLLQPGRAVSRNAIRLLNLMGFDDAITAEADRMAEHFLQTGSWK